MSAIATVNDRPITISAGVAYVPNAEFPLGYLSADNFVCPTDPAEPYEIVVLATSEGQAGDDRARAAAAAISSYLQDNCGDVAAEALRQSFRTANTALYQDIATDVNDASGVDLLVALLKGKYLSIGLLGDHRGYLVRSGRLTPLTRDMRVARSRGSRSQRARDSDSNSESTIALLGEQERLNSRAPAVFEIIVLPEDELAFVSRGLIDTVPESSLSAGFANDAQQSADALTALAPAEATSPILVAVMSAAPAREVRATDLTSVPTRSHQKLVFLAVALLIVLLAIAAAYFLL
jgi:PPM family protein phosphatase